MIESHPAINLIAQEVLNPKLDHFAVIVKAREAFAHGDSQQALTHLAEDCEEFFPVAPLLSRVVRQFSQERQFASKHAN